ncbi:hypothetical protein EG68_06804 [Paragonimus skrjabini miyazakii]|uniref:Uncharacterized protein n=1 Tax=Paragonimus skrjabini miyazakii TaxID=59628 RepID=A0A8S9YMH0_9TREM|nr:hypothetical protein EG68_06804 [Paragonimus skrjabini miyazakii]
MATVEQKSTKVSRPNCFSAHRHQSYVDNPNRPVPPDTPWRRGDVIHSRGDLSNTNDFDNANGHSQLFHCFQRPNRGRSQWYRGRRRPSNSAYVTGLYTAHSLRNSHGLSNRQGMQSRWNMSMPHGLQNCDISYCPPGYVDDGFIDDSLLTDLSQYSLQGKVKNDCSVIHPSELCSTLSVQRFQFSGNCVSTTYLPDTYGVSKINHPECDSPPIVQTQNLQKGVILPPILFHGTRSAENIAEVSVIEASPIEDILEITSNTDFKNPRRPTDYLRLVWEPDRA